MTSQPGQAWRSYYQSGPPNWLDPEHATIDFLAEWARGEWIARLLDAAGQRAWAGRRVLEAGCGTGIYSIALAWRGCAVDAFDYNAESLDIARYLVRKAERSGHSLPIGLYQGDLLNIPAAANSYDLVFNQAVLEYFADSEREAALREMARVTKPNGRVVAIVQHTDHPFQAIWQRQGWQGYTNQPAVIAYTPRRLARDLAAAGLGDVYLDGIRPWKAFFFHAAWFERRASTAHMAYLGHRLLERRVTLPRVIRRQLGVQLVGAGTKHSAASAS
jgi:SAM-dependent methyltransferase